MADEGARSAQDGYDEALLDLADALVATWYACELVGANLAEALSYALAQAARSLAEEASGDDEPVDHESAVGILVAQRPGSWEAADVVHLTDPIDLL